MVRPAARVLAALALTAALLGAAAGPAQAAGGGIACRYTVTQWQGGFTADLFIYNNSAAAINGWTVFWTFRTATQVTVTWNGSITQGTPFDATGRNGTFNAVIQPGGMSAFGWTATAAATEVPAQILLNGAVCPQL